MQVRRREEEDAKSRHSARMQPRRKSEAEWQREEWRRNFFEAQERRLRSRQRKMRRLEKEEAAFRQRREQQKLLRKEQFEIKREAEREHRMLLHLREELTVSEGLGSVGLGMRYHVCTCVHVCAFVGVL